MLNINFLLLFIAVVLNAGASLLMKKGADAIIDSRQIYSLKSLIDYILPAVNVYTIIGLVMLGISFITFIFILSRIPISIAQPMLAMAYIIVAISAHYIFGESLTISKVAGIITIIIGVYLLSSDLIGTKIV